MIAGTDRRRWLTALVAAGAVIAAIRLGGLASSPPGLHQDEASIGYDAWAIAHHGADQHGVHLPLFLRSFDDYKSPLYVYLLAPLTLILPLTPLVVRLPAALCGLGVCALAAGTAHLLTLSRAATLLILVTAGTMPWLVLEGRVAFEVSILTLALTAALWCLASAEAAWAARTWAAGAARYGGAGLALSLALVAYPTGRLLAPLLVAAFALLLLRARRPLRWWWPLPALPAAGCGVVAAWGVAHPGALTGRFAALSVASDHPGALIAASRFAANWASYFDAPFLFALGDRNPRHSTGLGGMLLVAMAPAVIAGAVTCWRRRRELLPAACLLGLLLAPIPAALTQEGSPHALRSATMIPFLLETSAYGWAALLPWLARHRRWAVALGAVGALQATLYLLDLEVTYPERSAGSFDVGIGEAIVAARGAAGSHRMLVSSTLGQPYAHALFRLRPAPGASLAATLESINVRQADPAQLAGTARPGDVLVLNPRDRPPPDGTMLFEEWAPTGWGSSGPAVVVYRR